MSMVEITLRANRRRFSMAVPDEDLIQDGAMELMRSVEKFDMDRGFKFSTFAIGNIRLRMQEFAEKWDRNRYNARKAGRDCPGTISLDRENSEGESYLHSTIGAPSEDDEDQRTENSERVAGIVSKLPRRLQEVVRLRFNEGLTLEKVGILLGGISSERVRQLEVQAIEMLRQPIEAAGLRPR